MRRGFPFLLVFLFVCLTPFPLPAIPYISIGAPEFRPIRILIPDFVATAGNKRGGELSRNVANKLLQTGFFIAKTEEEPPRWEEKIKMPGGADTDVDFLLRGKINLGRVNISLFDAVSGKKIATRNYTYRPGDSHVISRRIADYIMLTLTGERGPFDSKIALIVASGGAWEIRAVNFDGTGERVLHREDNIIMTPRWSPSGRYLAFTSYKDGGPTIFVKDILAGRTLQIPPQAGINLAGDWEQNSEGLLLSASDGMGGEQIYHVGKNGSGKRRLTETDAINISPSWSPDGLRIAFVSDQYGVPQIFVMNADGSNGQRLFGGGYGSNPAWSPRGDLIAFESRISGVLQICTISKNGSDYRQLTAGDRDCRSPSWSPCGRFIAFYIKNKGAFVMNADGSNIREILAGDCRGVYWSRHYW